MRLTPMTPGETYYFNEETIQKHGIDIKTGKSELPIYSNSMFQIRKRVVIRSEDLPDTRSLLQKIRSCFTECSCLFPPPQQDEPDSYRIGNEWAITRIEKNS